MTDRMFGCTVNFMSDSWRCLSEMLSQIPISMTDICRCLSLSLSLQLYCCIIQQLNNFITGRFLSLSLSMNVSNKVWFITSMTIPSPWTWSPYRPGKNGSLLVVCQGYYARRISLGVGQKKVLILPNFKLSWISSSSKTWRKFEGALLASF